HTLPVRPLGRSPRERSHRVTPDGMPPPAEIADAASRDAGDEHASPTFAARDRGGRPVPSMMPFSLGSLVGRSARASTLSWIAPSTSLNSTVAHPMSLYDRSSETLS